MLDLCMRLLFHIFVKSHLGIDFVIICLTRTVLITNIFSHKLIKNFDHDHFFNYPHGFDHLR